MLHPDQYVYYNAFVGGVDGAQRKFKLDYWANSYAEAVHGLADYLRAAIRRRFRGARVHGRGLRPAGLGAAIISPPISG